MISSKRIIAIYLTVVMFPMLTMFYPEMFSIVYGENDIFSFLKNLPYFCLLLAAFLGINLGVRKVFYISALLLFSYFVLLEVPDGLFTSFGIGKVRARQVLAISFPVGLIIPFLFHRGKLLSIVSCVILVSCFVPFLVLGFMFTRYPDIFVNLVRIGDNILIDLKIPFVSLCLFLPAIYFLLSSINKKTKMFNIATLLALIPFGSSIQIGMMHGVSKETLVTNTLVSYCAISIVILHSIYTLYWESVYFDPLSAIPNRRAMIDKFGDMNKGYSVAVIDIDKFKSFNDTYGHDEGDNVIKLVANMLFRESGGRAYRFGGEEFVLIYDHVNEKQLEADLNRIRETIANKPFYIRKTNQDRKQYSFSFVRKLKDKISRKKEKSTPKSKKLQITVSMGGAVKIPITKADNKTPYEDYLKLADNALYKAKENGRNRVEMSPE